MLEKPVYKYLNVRELYGKRKKEGKREKGIKL